MKKTNILGLTIATAALFAANSALAHEHNACQSRRDAATVGGFLGAGAGAAAGRALAATAVRPEGVIVGTLVGAIIGSKVGAHTQACDNHNYTQGHGRSYGDNYHRQGNNHQEHYGHQNMQTSPRVMYYNGPQAAPVQYNAGQYNSGQYNSGQGNYEQGGWYVPSSQSYYGQERGGAQYYAPAPQMAPVIVQQWQSGPAYVPAPVQYAPAPQYAPQQPQTPCGQWVCQ